jgi:hypothetical protein
MWRCPEAAILVLDEKARSIGAFHVLVDDNNSAFLAIDGGGKPAVIFMIGEENESVDVTGSQPVEAGEFPRNEIAR